MDTMRAFMMGEANRGKPMMVFDWDKAATIIRECKVKDAYAGLARDWEYTGGSILLDGIPVEVDECECYLASTWAVPQLQFGGDTIECWRWQDDTPGWDANTIWPESALALLRGSLDFSEITKQISRGE